MTFSGLHTLLRPKDGACEFSERYHILNPKEEAIYPPASPKNLKYLASTVKKREVYKDPGSGHIPSKQWPDSLCCFLNYRPRAARCLPSYPPGLRWDISLQKALSAHQAQGGRVMPCFHGFVSHQARTRILPLDPWPRALSNGSH